MSEQRARRANSQLRKYCQQLMTHLSEVQAELNAQNSHHSDKTQASKQREEELQRRLDVLIEENEQLHETRFVGCVVCYYIYI